MKSKALTIPQMDVAKKIETWIAKGKTEVEACHKAKITTEKYRQMRIDNPELNISYQKALEDQVAYYEKEGRRRAVKGFFETTYDGNGKVLKRVHKYDSEMLQKFLAAKDKRFQTQRAQGTNITFDLGGLLDKARARAKKAKVVDV